MTPKCAKIFLIIHLGILKSGAQVSGGGQVFETIEDIDFSSPFNNKGETNRLKIPNFDANNKLISYTITKREAVVNGTSRIFTYEARFKLKGIGNLVAPLLKKAFNKLAEDAKVGLRKVL